jgi:hypothetical protein
MRDREIVQLRVMGAPAAVDQLVADLQGAAPQWCDVRTISPPYPNRREGGVRRYVTLLVPIRTDAAPPASNRSAYWSDEHRDLLGGSRR